MFHSTSSKPTNLFEHRSQQFHLLDFAISPPSLLLIPFSLYYPSRYLLYENDPRCKCIATHRCTRKFLNHFWCHVRFCSYQRNVHPLKRQNFNRCYFARKLFFFFFLAVYAPPLPPPLTAAQLFSILQMLSVIWNRRYSNIYYRWVIKIKFSLSLLSHLMFLTFV